MRIIELFTFILGFGVSHADLEIYKPWPPNIVRKGWDFTMARAPPKTVEDCVHYFYACTDWQAPGWPGNRVICKKMFGYCDQFIRDKTGKFKPFLAKNENYTTFTPSISTKPVSCEQGWIPNAETGSCYKILERRTNWIGAKRNCDNENATMISIHSSRENNFIKDLMRGSNEKIGFWLGGNDIRTEGTWAWADESPVTYFDWQNRQPNNLNGNQHCMFLWHSDLKWHDEACTDWKNLPTVCKKAGEIISSLSASTTTSGRCAEGWTEFTATGSCYKVMPEKAKWNISKSICESEKAELSSIRSNEEWDFVKDFLTQNGFTNGAVWIGGTDASVEGSWQWTDNSSVIIIDWNQDPIQPNNDGDCLRAGANPISMWDGDCEDKYPPLCKIPGTSTKPSANTSTFDTTTSNETNNKQIKVSIAAANRLFTAETAKNNRYADRWTEDTMAGSNKYRDST